MDAHGDKLSNVRCMNLAIVRTQVRGDLLERYDPCARLTLHGRMFHVVGTPGVHTIWHTLTNTPLFWSIPHVFRRAHRCFASPADSTTLTSYVWPEFKPWSAPRHWCTIPTIQKLHMCAGARIFSKKKLSVARRCCELCFKSRQNGLRKDLFGLLVHVVSRTIICEGCTMTASSWILFSTRFKEIKPRVLTYEYPSFRSLRVQAVGHV